MDNAYQGAINEKWRTMEMVLPSGYDFARLGLAWSSHQSGPAGVFQGAALLSFEGSLCGNSFWPRRLEHPLEVSSNNRSGRASNRGKQACREGPSVSGRSRSSMSTKMPGIRAEGSNTD